MKPTVIDTRLTETAIGPAAVVRLMVSPELAAQLRRGQTVELVLSPELSAPPDGGPAVVAASDSSGDPSPAPQPARAAPPAGATPLPEGSAPALAETNAERARRLAKERRDSETEEAKAARRAGHHADWAKAHRGFAARLGEILPSADPDTVSAWLEQLTPPAKRCSARSREELKHVLDKLSKSERARETYLAWAAAPAPNPCETCGAPVVRVAGKACNPEVVRATTKPGRSQGGRVVLVLDDGSERAAIRDPDGELGGRIPHAASCASARRRTA